MTATTTHKFLDLSADVQERLVLSAMEAARESGDPIATNPAITGLEHYAIVSAQLKSGSLNYTADGNVVLPF